MRNLVYTVVLVSSLLLSACAKTDSEFAERYKKNSMGAEVVDGVKTQEAAENAEGQGLMADVLGMNKSSSGNMHTVTAMIAINNFQVPVTTTHSSTDLRVTKGSVNVDGFLVIYSAVCSNAACNPFYVSLEVQQNSRMLIQEGVRKYFDGVAGDDTYQWFTPEEARPLISGPSFSGSDLVNGNVLVGFLNGKSSNGSTGSLK